MNQKRRKLIANIIEHLDPWLRDIEWARDEEQDAYDNLPESLQDSDKGCTMEENIDDLTDAYDGLEEAINLLKDIINRK